MSKEIKDVEDDVIGSLAVRLMNDKGVLKLQWVAGEFTKQLKPEKPFFECVGQGNCGYDIVVSVISRPFDPKEPVERRRVRLGTEPENCGDDVLQVRGIGETVPVKKGERKEIRVGSREVKWHCGLKDTNDRTIVPRNTNLVIIVREKDGQRFRVECYREG